MYTAYIAFAAILVLSFVTGSIILIVDHKPNLDKRVVLHDEEII